MIMTNGPTRRDPKTPWYSIRNAADASKPLEIYIYDAIGKDIWDGTGVGAEDFANELKQIPSDREILVCINSPGGNVWDGLAIYNLLLQRKNRVTTRIDGVAASIASVIALAGKEVRMGRATQFMIHDPATIAAGKVPDMEQAINRLKAGKQSILAAYKTKTGRPDEELSQKMTDETWFDGEAAKEYGFCDVLTEDLPLTNNFDVSDFRRVPETFRKLQNHSAPNKPTQPGGGANPKQIMNREQLIALLKEHGVTVTDTATDEQLAGMLKTALSAKKAEPAKTAAPAPATPDNNNNGDVDARFKSIEAKYEKQRRASVEKEIDNAIAERRIIAAQRKNWIDRAMADETVLTDIAALPQHLPGEEPVLQVTAEDPKDICKGIMSLRDASQAMVRGNTVTAQAMSERGVQINRIVNGNLQRLLPMLNANVIDPALKLNVILNVSLAAYRRRIIALNAFSTVFSNLPRLQGTAKVEVPYYPLFTTASRDFVDADGYVFDETSAVEKREITINKRKYQSFSYSSTDLARQPFLDTARAMSRKAEQIGIDVFGDVMSLATRGTYGAPVKALPKEAFTPEDVTDLDGEAEKRDWPEAARSLILDTDFRVNIAKNMLKVNEAGSDSALRQGVVGVLSGFDIFSNPRIPDNGEHLKGLACLPSGILFASSPIQPAPGIRKLLVAYEMAVDAELGATLEYKHWGDPQIDKDREVVEANYGFGPGEVEAIMLIADQL
jgi:ATP-dependent protease ClpP protease subunit